jgi:aryl-alcohol dehydrogenase-like predicted oxidoreductase
MWYVFCFFVSPRHVGLSNETPYGVMRSVHLHELSVELGRTRQESAGFVPRVVSVQQAYSLLCRTFDSGEDRVGKK